MQVINPPLFGVIAGVFMGLSPAGPLLFLAPSPSASRMPFELKIVVGKHCSYLRRGEVVHIGAGGEGCVQPEGVWGRRGWGRGVGSVISATH